MTTLSGNILSVTASTKRPPSLSGGKRGAPAANLTELACSALLPVDSETKHRMEINTPYQVWDTYTAGDADVLEGDTLTVSSIDYQVLRVETWSWMGFSFLRLFLEGLKR